MKWVISISKIEVSNFFFFFDFKYSKLPKIPIYENVYNVGFNWNLVKKMKIGITLDIPELSGTLFNDL